MKDNIRHITGTIPYTIVRSSRRKTSEIQVGEHGIEIRVPFHKRDKEIWDMVDDKKQWIHKKYLEFQTGKKQFKTRLEESHIERRTERLAPRIGVRPSKISIKSLKTRWGSATSNGAITINSRLLRAPKDVIDYVIIHELCHLKIRGHSSAYWNLVGIHMRDYEKKIEWLGKYGRFL